VALFFAVEKHFDEDSAVYVWFDPRYLNLDELKDTSPYQQQEIVAFLPSHISSRISGQDSVLSVHPDPDLPVEFPKLEKIIIPHEMKYIILGTLRRYGIHRGKLFPNLDGVAHFVKSQFYLI
jgi:hypothetical protein